MRKQKIILFLFFIFCIVFYANFSFSQWDGNDYKSNAQLQIRWVDKFFFENYKFRGDEYVLDIGCGDGRISNQIADYIPKGKVIGFDKSSSMIETSLKSFGFKKNLVFFVGDAEDQTLYKKHFNQSQFDLVVSFSVLHWVKNQKSVLDGVYHVLKKGGKFYIIICSKGGDPIQEIADQLITHKQEYVDLFKDFKDPISRYTVGEYSKILRGSNFYSFDIKETKKEDKFMNREDLVKQIKSWLPHYHYLKEKKGGLISDKYINDIIDLYLIRYPPLKNGTIVLHDNYLEISVTKL